MPKGDANLFPLRRPETTLHCFVRSELNLERSHFHPMTQLVYKPAVLSKSPFIPPCLPTVRKEAPTGLAWVHEVKFDGYSLQLHKEGKDVALFSKNGNQRVVAHL